MKQNYILKIVFLFLLFPALFFGQTKAEIKEIKKKTNSQKLIELSAKYKSRALKEKQAAWALADQNGWQKKYIDSNGITRELIKVSQDGKPIYYKTDNLKKNKNYFAVVSNAVAARATRANWLHNGGGLGLNVEGQNMTAHVWDGGVARRTHQEYDGIGGNNRVSLGDAGGLNFHAAHVMGTVVSSGFVVDAKGMAPQAKGIAFDWGNDDAEIAVAAANGMLLSNHSYGFGAEDIPDAWFGAYLSFARTQDEIMFNAPYYLQVISAGNDGNDNSSNGDPLDGQIAYDKLSGMKTAKNNIIVANARDPEIDPTDGSLISIERNSSSSEGPTDDLRIKPELTGNGTGLFSSYHNADDSYNTLSGTSMSAPNVTGSLLLLQQHYNNVNGKFMRAATLKGLALHTADDAGLVGPDAQFGWGLMNTKKAAETISVEGLESLIIEETINQGETLTYVVKSDEVNPLLASISWTDAPGEVTTGSNNTSAVLVNDLDIRITKNSDTFEPWKLTAVNANTKGDNVVDPYERVDVENATGEYTITITHKGTLNQTKQDFSLVVTGISSDFTFTASNSVQSVCSDQGSAVFNFSYKQAQTTNTSLSFQNLPANATGELSRSSINENGDFSFTVNNLENVSPGTYEIEIIGNNGNQEIRRTLELTILTPVEITEATTLSSPSNEEKGVANTINLSWDQNSEALTYYLEVSENPSFTTLFDSTTQTELSYELTGLASNKVYYWRVRAENDCRTGDFSETFSFQTSVSDCSNTYSATDFANADISSVVSPEIAYVPINIPDDITISRLIVNTNIEHTNVSDLRVYLQEPSPSINQIDLLTNVCDNGVDINATFDDTGVALVCDGGSPVVSGTVRPSESLSTNTAGKSSQGLWFLVARDDTQGNGGNILSASITVCTSSSNTNVPNFTNNGIDIAANGSYTFKSTDIEATTDSETANSQVYTLTQLPTKGTLRRNGVDLGIGDTFTQDDINTGLVVFTNTQTELFSDSFKVDLTNAANGWLPNQTINLTATTLSNELLEIDGLNVYPNPSAGDITVKLNPKTQNDVQVTLFDLQGRTVLSKTFRNTSLNFSEQINVRNFSNGVYLLNIKEGNYSSTRRIIISK